MQKNGQKKRTWIYALISIAVSVLLAFLLEFVQLKTQPPQYIREFQNTPKAIFPSESALFDHCLYQNGRLIPTGGDPKVIMPIEENASAVRLVFAEGLPEKTKIQIFYSSEEHGFSEFYSAVFNTSEGMSVVDFQLPEEDSYRQLRVDIDIESLLQSIQVSDEPFLRVGAVAESMHPWRIIIVAVCLSALLFLLRYTRVFVRVCSSIKNGVRYCISNPKRTVLRVGILLLCGFVMWILFGLLFAVLKLEYNKPFMIFAVIFGLVLAILALSRQVLSQKPQWMFLLIMLTAGSVMIVYTPAAIGTSWDEGYHFRSALNMSYVDEIRYTQIDAKQAQMQEYSQVNRQDTEAWYRDMQGEYEEGVASVTHAPVSLQKLSAVPSGAFIFLARALGLPYHWIIAFGRLGNLLMYAVAGFFAVRRLRSGKILLSLLLLAPTNLLMASSYSYDPFLTAFSALGLSYFFAEWQEPDKPLTWKNMLVMVGSLTLACTPKAIYFPLLAILLFLPKQKWTNRKNRWIFALLILLGIAVLVASFMLPFFDDMDSKSDFRGGSGVSAPDQLKFILTQPFAYMKILLLNTLNYLKPSNGLHSLSLIYFHGDCPFSEVFYILLFVIAFTDKNEYDKSLHRKWGLRAATAILLLAVVFLIETSMYISFTPVGNATIGGCQQRYLLPLLFPALMLLGSSKIQNQMNRAWYNGIALGTGGAVCFATVLIDCMVFYLPN